MIQKPIYRPSGKANEYAEFACFGAKCEALCKKHGRKYYFKLDLREAMMKGGNGGADNGV